MDYLKDQRLGRGDHSPLRKSPQHQPQQQDIGYASQSQNMRSTSPLRQSPRRDSPSGIADAPPKNSGMSFGTFDRIEQ